MNFSYLNLPELPASFIPLCLKYIPLSYTDKKLIELNKKEGISHSITYLPQIVKNWIKQNIIPKIDPYHQHPELLSKMMLHINEYIEHPEGNGVHPIHFDYGRKYAFNYILTTGGDKPITSFYDDDKTTLLEEHYIEPLRWHLIYVNPRWHGVRGQLPNQYRTIISLCFDPKNLGTFNPLTHFEKILCRT